jgi:hypothetical protein
VTRNGHGEDFRLHFAGCSSSCAQHQIADVGIEGVLKKVDGEFVEAMDIRIGGRLGADPKFGEVVVKKVPHWELNETLLRIFDLYEQHHADGETFRDFAGPHRARVVDARARAGAEGSPHDRTRGLTQAVERHHRGSSCSAPSRRRRACSSTSSCGSRPDARIVTIDTGVLFPETLATWRAFEQRFGIDVEGRGAGSAGPVVGDRSGGLLRDPQGDSRCARR